MSFGTRIKMLRQNSNMTQEELAIVLKVSRSAIGRYENDERFPDKDTLIKLAEIFKVSLDFLLLGQDVENDSYGVDYSLVKEHPNPVNDYINQVITENFISLEDIELNDDFIENIIFYGIYAAIEIEKIKKQTNLK